MDKFIEECKSRDVHVVNDVLGEIAFIAAANGRQIHAVFTLYGHAKTDLFMRLNIGANIIYASKMDADHPYDRDFTADAMKRTSNDFKWGDPTLIAVTLEMMNTAIIDVSKIDKTCEGVRPLEMRDLLEETKSEATDLDAFMFAAQSEEKRRMIPFMTVEMIREFYRQRGSTAELWRGNHLSLVGEDTLHVRLTRASEMPKAVVFAPTTFIFPEPPQQDYYSTFEDSASEGKEDINEWYSFYHVTRAMSILDCYNCLNVDMGKPVRFMTASTPNQKMRQLCVLKL